MAEQFDVVVAGGGIAGLTAGMTAARLGLSTQIVTGDVLGGHLLSIDKIEGYPGFEEGIPGYDLCPITQGQAAEAGADFSMSELTALTQSGEGWTVATGEGDFLARAVILATGTSFKTLGVPGETELQGKGVSQCASCDAPLLRGKPTIVVGGGDSACQEALTLAEHASGVILLTDGGALTAQAAYRQQVEEHSNIEIRCNAVVEQILGEDGVTGARVRSGDGNAAEDLAADGVFVFIGLTPNTAALNALLSLDETGRIPTDTLMRTTLPGLFAAGTIRSGAAGRAAAAAGDGAAAAIAAGAYLAGGDWPS